MIDRSLRIRAQEIAAASTEGITVKDAMRRALSDRFGSDREGLLEFAASVGSSGMKDLRKRTYDLPDPDQGTLLQIPQVIGITTPEGDLLIPRDKASLGQVRQWAREASQHHSVQKMRFKRFRDGLDALKEEPDELPWWSARSMLAGPAVEEDGDE